MLINFVLVKKNKKQCSAVTPVRDGLRTRRSEFEFFCMNSWISWKMALFWKIGSFYKSLPFTQNPLKQDRLDFFSSVCEVLADVCGAT